MKLVPDRVAAEPIRDIPPPSVPLHAVKLVPDAVRELYSAPPPYSRMPPPYLLHEVKLLPDTDAVELLKRIPPAPIKDSPSRRLQKLQQRPRETPVLR